MKYSRKTPTQMSLEDLRLPVSDDRFHRAMALAAKDMGGQYDRHNGKINLPIGLSIPSFIVLYRKFPCGMLAQNGAFDEKAGYPCVSFDVIPASAGDPRRSKIYKSFRGEAEESKVLFGKFLGWLKILSKALERSRQAQQGMARRVASRWVKVRQPRTCKI